MSALITVLFFVFLLLFIVALAAIVRPRWINMKTRKEASQAAGGCLVVLFILGPFLPDNSEPEKPSANNAEEGQTPERSTSQQGCEDLSDRTEQLECEYRRAMNAWSRSSIHLATTYQKYLDDACPLCKDAMQACIDEIYSRNPEKKMAGPSTTEYDRCMEQAWPSAKWPRMEPLAQPKLPQELAERGRQAAEQGRAKRIAAVRQLIDDDFRLCRAYNRLVRVCIEMSPNIREAQCPTLNGMSRRELATHLANREWTVPENHKSTLVNFMVLDCSRYA